MSYLDYLWHDMQMKRAMTTAPVCMEALLLMSWVTPAWRACPPPARHPPIVTWLLPRLPCRPLRRTLEVLGLWWAATA